jgi:hypothetical protein
MLVVLWQPVTVFFWSSYPLDTFGDFRPSFHPLFPPSSLIARSHHVTAPSASGDHYLDREVASREKQDLGFPGSLQSAAS